MNLNEIPAWNEIESQPWFASLTPEEKQQSLTKWQGDMMQFAKDPKEKFAVAATSKAKARSFFGEEMPDDPIADALQRRQKDLEDIGSRYDAFSKGELEEDDEEVLTLNDTLKGNTPYSVIKGRLFVSPQLVWDKAAYEKVVNEAPVDEDERVLAMSAYDGSKERAAEGVVNSLGYTDEAFRDFAAKGFKEGKSNAAILDEWKANNKLPDGILGSLRGVGRQAYFGLRSGLSGLERAMGGLGGFFGSESAQKYAEESGKEAQSYMQRTLGEGPEFIGELTSGAVSIIPTIAAGAAASFFTEGAALPAAASITAGAIQSAGATQAETYEFYRNQGLDHANALAESRVDGLVSGLITGAITHYAGKLGDKIGLGKGIEGLFSGPASKIASKLTQREISESLKAGAKAVGGSFLQEGSEELLDQAAQDAYSMIKRDPTLTLAEAINNALQAGKVGAVLGGAAEAGKIGLKSLLNSAKFSVAETPLEKELQNFFEIKQTAADAVVDNPNLRNYVKVLGTAKSVVDENLAVDNRLTAEVLKEEVNRSAENLKDNIETDVVKVAANIAPTVNEAPPVVDGAPPVVDETRLKEEVAPDVLAVAKARNVTLVEPPNEFVERAWKEGVPGDREGFVVFEDTYVIDPRQLPEGAIVGEDFQSYALPNGEGRWRTFFMDVDGTVRVSPALTPDLEAAVAARQAEAPAISPKPPVSPAVGTAPIGGTQQPQPIETPTNAAPEITLEESLRQEPQDRVEVGTPEETGVGDSVQRAAEGEKVSQDQQKFLSDLQFYGTARLGDNTFAIKQASDDSFYIEKTTGGQRSTVASGFPDIEAAQRGAAELVTPTPEEVASTGQPPTLVEEALPERGASVETIASGGGMSVEEARQFLARRSDSGEPLIFGRPFSEISGMQQNERPRVLQASDKLRAVKQVVGDINKFRIPVSQDVVNAYGITLPEGYVKQGDLYVFQKPSPPTTGAVPPKTLPDGQEVTPGGVASPGVAAEAAPEPAPEAQPVSQPVQAFRDAVSQMSPTAQAKWTPELRATAEAYLDSGGITGLQGLSDVQQKVVGRFLPEEVKAAFDAEDARKRAQRNKLPDHRESSLPPTPGKQIRKIGKGAMESVPVVLDEIAKVIPNIRELVEVRESVEGEPDAEGFYDPQADKAVVLVDKVYLKPQHGGSQEAALRETIIHELLHRGFAKLRQTNPQLFEQFEAFSLADTNDAQFEALVRRGYSMYSNWKDDPAQNQKAREEIFIRKAVVDLNFKGIEALKSPTSLASQFFSWLRGLLNKLLGRKVDDETLLHWSRVFLNAAQADFIEKTPGERMLSTDKDAEYLDAVEAGDMEKAQRMVDEAAKAAGYNVGPVWHGSPDEEFTIFQKPERDADEDGFWFSKDREWASKFGPTRLFYIKNAKTWGGDDFVVKEPNSIKSADPVTYDDAGNAIPLSQRFQTVSPDIRYSLGEPPDTQAEADALREVTPSSQALDKFRETFGTPRQDVGQVLGKKEGSVYTQAQVAPLSQHARNVIGFDVNEEGDPVVNPKATQKALDLVSKLLNTKGYASRFNTQAAKLFEGTPVDPEIASAVLVQELQAYANRLSASSPKAEDQILKAALTPFYNTVILGNYLTLRTAGRALQAAGRVSNMDDARKSREEAEKAVDKEITKQLGDGALPAAEGMDKAGVEGGVDAIKDDIPAPADPTLRLLDLAVESLDEVAKADANAVFEMLLDIAQLEELVAQDEKVGSKAMSILRSPNLAARNYPTDPAERKALLAQKKAEVAEKLAKLRSSLEGAKPETKKKVKERATKAGGKAKTAPKVSDKEEDPITKEINALAAELGTPSKLDQAGLDVVKQIAKKLVAKFQPAKLDALKDKVEAVVYKYVQNAERLELAEFSKKMTADLDAIGLKKPELQEALVAKAWAYHFAAPTKAVQALTAKMKSAERADRGGPESVANVRKAINGAVNSTEENRDAFVTRLTDQLVALGVEAQTAEAAAKAAFEYRAKQADKKIERVMETLRLGKRRALLKSSQNTKEADRTEEWQRATLKAAFVEAGLTNKQAEKGADKAMQEAAAIFATAEMKVAEIKQRSVQKFLDSLASVEDETPVTKTKQDNLRSVFKDATLDEEFNEAVLMDRFQTLGATEAQAKALVEKVAEVREDKAEALAEAKRKQVNKVIDATYKRIAQLESGTPSEKAKKQESLRNAVGAAIKAKEFDEAAFRASVASFGASEPQVETLVQNVKKLRQLGESKPLSKAKLRQFLLSFPKNVLANPEQREALLRSFLKGKEYSEAEINRIVPQVLRDFDTGYQKARKAYLDELEKKLKPKQGQKESKQDQQNRKMLNALRSGLADTTSEASVALAKSLGFEAFRPQDDHILSKLDEEMRKLREQGRLSDSNAKFDAIKSLLIRRRPPRGFGEVVAQSWITSALSSLSNLAVNVWAPMGEAGVRLMSDIVRATALGKFDEIPLYLEAAGKAMKGTLSRFNFAVKTDTFTNSVNTLIAGMASMKDEMQRSAAVLKDKNASPAAKANAGLRYAMSFGDYSRRILSSIDDTWYTALSSYVGSSNLIKLLGDAKMPKKAVEAIVFHANNDALNQARAEYETLQAVEQFIEAMRGKTNEEIDAGFEYLGLNDASVTKEQANYIQELVSAFQSLRLRSGATGDELIKRALKELRNFRASVSVRATELGQMRTKELVREALSDTQTPAQVEEAIKEFDENAKKAASFGMGLHRVEGVPPYDILGNMFGIVDAMGRQAVQKSPLLGRMIVGFFGIPLNLLNRAVWFTPYGLGRYFLAKWQMAKNPEEKFYEYSMASQRERTMRFTEAAVGTSMTMLLYALGVARDSDDKEDEGFYITLGGPSNKTEYDAWYARGFRKFSICYKTKSGSVVSVPYGRGTGEVLKGPLMLLGAFDDMRLNKKLGDREDMSSVIEYLNAAAAGIGKQATFLGAKNTAGAFFSEQFGTSTVSNLAYSAANLIPFNGLDRSISALALGPPDRSRTGAIWANIPIVRHLAHQPAINVFGDPWGNKSESALNQLWDRQWNLGLLPLNISAPLTGNQKRLYNFIGERLMGPSDPLRGALELRNGYLTDEEFYRYKQYRGKQMAQTWLTDLDRWRKLDDDSLSKAIAELSTKATKKAKDRFNYK